MSKYNEDQVTDKIERCIKDTEEIRSKIAGIHEDLVRYSPDFRTTRIMGEVAESGLDDVIIKKVEDATSRMATYEMFFGDIYKMLRGLQNHIEEYEKIDSTIANFSIE